MHFCIPVNLLIKICYICGGIKTLCFYRRTVYITCVLADDGRFLDESPDGVVYAVMCFLVRIVEALGAAAFLTTSFAIIANTFPDRVATMFVRILYIAAGVMPEVF